MRLYQRWVVKICSLIHFESELAFLTERLASFFLPVTKHFIVLLVLDSQCAAEI